MIDNFKINVKSLFWKLKYLLIFFKNRYMYINILTNFKTFYIFKLKEVPLVCFVDPAEWSTNSQGFLTTGGCPIFVAPKGGGEHATRKSFSSDDGWCTDGQDSLRCDDDDDLKHGVSGTASQGAILRLDL